MPRAPTALAECGARDGPAAGSSAVIRAPLEEPIEQAGFLAIRFPPSLRLQQIELHLALNVALRACGGRLHEAGRVCTGFLERAAHDLEPSVREFRQLGWRQRIDLHQ